MIHTTQVGEMTSELQNIDFSTLTHKDILSDKIFKRRRSVIIATLANSVVTAVDVQKMMEAGLNVARFRISHQSTKDNMKLLGKIKAATTNCCQKYGVSNWPLATCIDLKNRTVKTGILEQDVPYIVLKKDSVVQLTCDTAYINKCNTSKIFVDNPNLASEVHVGMEIAIDGDEISLVCTEIVSPKSIKTLVMKTGKLRHICGVCFRGLKTTRPFVTKRDSNVIKFVIENQVDAIILNHVEDKEGIKTVKKCISKKVRRPIMLCSISTEKAIDNIDEIIKESDGIILLREFLPYEVSTTYKHRLNTIQKWVIGKCLQAGKPIYISGGVMQNAVRYGVIASNEVSDVTNAILDGVSGFILKDCENIDNAIDAVKLLDDICRTVEPYTCTKNGFWRLTNQYLMPVNAAEASVMACIALANQANAQVIILPTVTGRTAKALIQVRPCCLVLAVCTNVRVTRMLQLYKSMVPLLYSGEPSKRFYLTLTARINFAVEYAVKVDWLHYGDTYAVLKRSTDGSSYCDMISILTVGISNKPMVECEDGDDMGEAQDISDQKLNETDTQ
ncbi:pyruvate kinase-like [Leguminivora glycinivorella]|uniref:pyruvate kinase-like n=1 Tax=Leguminivora glycinivorella TaxID=1035111 RepID=UPI00200E5195|nr:pyruvate kinase-like [Leguminivora glycinivorella]XP_048006863.1 pyruvate kinase-like [Leguminivora glycinivorella]